MAIKTELVEYTDNGVTLEGYLAWDDAGAASMPGVMISHAWAGRSEFECGKARLLAELGYAGFAHDLYGKGVLGGGTAENAKLMQPFLDDRGMLQTRLAAVLETLRGRPMVDASRIAAMGYCFGGLCVLDLARTGADIQGVVSLHGLLGAPGNTAGVKITAKVLALHGWDDPMAPPARVDSFAKEMTEAGADWQLHAYGNTLHAFTNPAADDLNLGVRYNAAADRRSWQSTRNFLAELFG